MTRPELEYKMSGLLGGRAAEQLVFREISTGAADDLARATDIARAMVLRYGMSDALGNVTYDRDRSPFLQPNAPAPQERFPPKWELVWRPGSALTQRIDAGALDAT